MFGDSYHSPDGRDLGLRIGHILETERMALLCTACGKARTFDWDTLRHFRRDMPLDWLPDLMRDLCPRTKAGERVCEIEVVSPELGCCDEG